jgi:glycine/D-amino acid oxidase-like deaminating enzyme
LTKRHTKDLALRIHREAQSSLNWIDSFINEENLDCDFSRCGRFHAAHNSSALERLKRAIAAQQTEFKTGAQIIDRPEQHRYIETDAYAGGAFYPEHASLHPAKYHQQLLALVKDAGGLTLGYCRVLNIEGDGNSGSAHQESTPLGTVSAAQVVIATNGYTDKSSPWLQSRVIPIGSYMIATQEIDPALLSKLLPSQCIISDSRKVVYYYRKSANGKRVIFGGRVSSAEIDPRQSAPLLKAELDRLLPALSGVKVSHSWSGTVAYTFDELPHIGQHQGRHYAMGYCGSGIGMASYLGMKLGHQVVASIDNSPNQQPSAFSETKFQTRPLYNGNPWFLAPSVAYYRLRDKFNF